MLVLSPSTLVNSYSVNFSLTHFQDPECFFFLFSACSTQCPLFNLVQPPLSHIIFLGDIHY